MIDSICQILSRLWLTRLGTQKAPEGGLIRFCSYSLCWLGLRKCLMLSPLTEAVHLVASLFRFAHKLAGKILRKVPRTFLTPHCDGGEELFTLRLGDGSDFGLELHFPGEEFFDCGRV